ncbi:uncharacterized protein K460DRAFT_426377 [Cucurbitaria berberidis CBS 394.84]|uniref:Rhodopsin domain-containing protein n=1 Tax=Cucurbitaria berberidis CBS 394.84 TaxID=1168544 RepID=A0A9P4GLF6_9PLEO|nr:uncharacterized protein K460DRAFT_426377 [Cucurbitaria berberidis CBS 394.84]KAF1847619.1 hypothetical protein K460DRAFT_426377 [Cucurbitaria berberidis CBS 394.84]
MQEKIMLYGVFLLGGFVTITSILRVTVVANSVRNQKDQIWNFIQRGIWNLVEANLGIICACLPMLKQLAKLLFLSMSSASKASRSTGHTNGSTKRDLPIIRNRQKFDLDDTINDRDIRTDVYMHRCKTDSDDAWACGKLYQMNSLPYKGASHDGRKSDETHIMSAKGMESGHSQGSVVSVDIFMAGPLDRDLGITKKL